MASRLRFCCVLLEVGVGAGVDGVNFWQPLSTFVNFCQPGVNLCQVLVSVGKAGVAGGAGGAAVLLRGEGHGVALLFWCECSSIWGKWGVCGGGSCLRRNDGKGRGNDGGGAGMMDGCESRGRGQERRGGRGDRGVSRAWRQFVDSHPPPNLPPGRGEG